MRNRKLCVFIFVTITVLSVSVTAYAKYEECTDEYCYEHEYDYKCSTHEAQTEIILPVIPEEEPEPIPPREPQTFTPQGNLTLVDDFYGELAEGKQFITVVTRNGHFFYIIIDRAGDRRNVHFLNQVDEYDLWAILSDESPRPAIPAQVEPMPEAVQQPEPEPPQDEGGGNGGVIIIIILLLALGGGAYYYFKVLKPKQATTGTTATNLDEFVFDDDEDDLDGTITDDTDFEDDMPDFTAEPFTFEAESEDR